MPDEEQLSEVLSEFARTLATDFPIQAILEGPQKTASTAPLEIVVERLRHYRALGFEEIMVRHITGDHQQMLRSFALIGQHVMPAIRDL